MKGWVGQVGWPVADGLPTLVVTHQLQVKHRIGKVRQSETDVVQLCYDTNLWHVWTLCRITIESLGRCCDCPVIGGDLVDGLVPAGWRRLILMYSLSTSGSTQPGERPVAARSGDISSTRQHRQGAGHATVEEEELCSSHVFVVLVAWSHHIVVVEVAKIRVAPHLGILSTRGLCRPTTGVKRRNETQRRTYRCRGVVVRTTAELLVCGLSGVFFQLIDWVVVLHPTHTHTHLFNGPLSRTTWVSRYQKGKTSLDFTGARDSEWQWHQLGHMQVCTSRQITMPAPHRSVFYRPDALPAAQPTASTHWRVMVLHPTRHKIGHFGDVSPSQSLGLVWKSTKPNTAKARVHQSKEMYYNTK